MVPIVSSKPRPSAVEALLVQAFQQVLDKERTQVYWMIFETGGDSIKAMRIASQMYKRVTAWK